MAKLRSINTGIWDDEWFCDLADREQNAPPVNYRGIVWVRGEWVHEVVIEDFNNIPRRKKINKSTRSRIFDRDGKQCVRCHSKNELEIDHILPVMCGGTNADENLRVLCSKCNRSRNWGYAGVGNTLVWRSRQ